MAEERWWMHADEQVCECGRCIRRRVWAILCCEEAICRDIVRAEMEAERLAQRHQEQEKP